MQRRSARIVSAVAASVLSAAATYVSACDSGYSTSGSPEIATEASVDDAPAAMQDGTTAAGPTYFALTDPKNWSSATFASVGMAASTGGAFDGRYVYYASSGMSLYRFDTTLPFELATSWQSTPIENAPNPWVLTGAAFDGRYVLYAPTTRSAGSAPFYMPQASAVVHGFDIHAPFDDAGSGVGRLDLNGIKGANSTFAGAGRTAGFVYFVPGAANPSVLARHRVGDALDASFDFPPIPQDASVMLHGGSGAGDGFYFTSATGLILQYSESTGLLEGYDFRSAEGGVPAAKNYFGAAFDGTYMYFAPFGNTTPHGLVLRFDARKAIRDGTAWSVFNMQTQWMDALGYMGASFDGRYVYFVPYLRAVGDNTVDPPLVAVPNSRIVRYDTRGDFETPGSWESFDLRQVPPAIGGYAGAVFDGEYLYLVPQSTDLLLRFHVRTPKAMPSVSPGTP